jgi:hypothetical protein
VFVLEHKAADAARVRGGGVLDAADNEFTIIGGVTGIRDEVDDVVEPGAYAETLQARTPKIIKDHDWGQRLGKVLWIKELLPGDPELPKTTANGQPWPAQAGALVARVRLFSSQEGKDAAERWREYGPDQQFSIGYVARMATKNRQTGVRHIRKLDLFEISDVLWGAMPLAGPIPGALATKMLDAIEQNQDVLDEDDESALADTFPGLHEGKAFVPGWATEVKYDTSPVGDPGGRQNWVDKAGGLPTYIRAVAHALIRNGHDESSAIGLAVGAVKRWASGGGKVSAKTRTKAAAAVAEWERKRTQAHATKAYHGWNPAADDTAGVRVPASSPEAKAAPRLRGSMEERRDALDEALSRALCRVNDDGHRVGWVSIVATFPDHVIASYYGDGECDSDDEGWDFPYTWDGEEIRLGIPTPVEITLSVTIDGDDDRDADGDNDEEGPDPDDDVIAAIVDPLTRSLHTVTTAIKTTRLTALEGKAGRMLSATNAAALQEAVRRLLDVLRAAGVDVVAAATPAPTGALVEGKTAAPEGLGDLPDPTELVASLRAFIGSPEG